MFQQGGFQTSFAGGQSFTSSSNAACAPPNSMVVYPSQNACAGCGPEAQAGDCAGTCGGAETVCFEPQRGVASVQWVQTAYGEGGYRPVTTYQYVGEGCGNYTKEVVTTWQGWRLRRICCIPLLCCLLLLPLLIWRCWPQGCNNPDDIACCAEGDVACVCSIDSNLCPTPPPGQQCGPGSNQPALCGPVQSCTVYGDPHVSTFDQGHGDYFTPGEYWIVKSPLVHIQGRYMPTQMTNGLSVTKSLAIGGPFIQNNKLVVTVNNVYWNGEPVISGFESLGARWNGPLGILITYTDQGTTMQKGRAEIMREKGVGLHVLHITLPQVSIMVNRWNLPDEGAYVNAKITMQRVQQAGASVQDGHCGNFNGNSADDDRASVRDRVGRNGVAQEELIFPGARTPIKPVTNRPDVNDCPQGTLNVAMDLCKKAESTLFPSNECLIDKCFGNITPL